MNNKKVTSQDLLPGGYIDTGIWNTDATWAHSGAASAALVAGCAQAAVKPRGLSDRGPLISLVRYY